MLTWPSPLSSCSANQGGSPSGSESMAVVKRYERGLSALSEPLDRGLLERPFSDDPERSPPPRLLL